MHDTVIAISQQLTQVANDFFPPKHMSAGLVYELIVTGMC
jgi:hypothetical protein